MHSMWPSVYVAPAYGLDGVKRGGILCCPHGRGSMRLAYNHCSLLHCQTFAQRGDSYMRVMWHLVEPDHLRDSARIGIRGSACGQQ